jgi:hypothetical protein
MEPEACEIARLPEDLLSAALARTSPRDACRAAAASPAFRAAADSDAVWARFLPRDLPPLADGELLLTPPSKKDLFLRLSDSPLLLPDKLVVRNIRWIPNPYYSMYVWSLANELELIGGFVRAEYVAGQGDRGQVLHAVREGSDHHMGRHAAVLDLDPSPRL